MKKTASCMIVLVMAAGSLQAANIYWDGSASGNWNNSANWSSTSPAETDTLPVSGANDILRFGDFVTANTTINVDALVTNQNINITDESNWTFGGQTMNWSDFGGANAPRLFMSSASSANTVTFNNTNHVVSGGALRLESRSANTTLDMNGPITGDQGVNAIFVNAGSGGIIRLDGANTFTGGLTADFSGGSTAGASVYLGGDLAADNGISIKTDAGNTGSNTFYLEPSGSITFAIGANAVNDGFTSTKAGSETQTVNLNGDFIFDLTGAASDAGIWPIVDAGVFSVSYGFNFSVSSTLGAFSKSGSVWSRSENGTTYEFDENTGILSIAGSPLIETDGNTVLTNFVTDRLTASASQVFSVSGSNLEGDVTVESDSDNFVVSLDDSTYASNVIIPVAGDTLASTDVYVKVPLGADSGNLAGSLLLMSANAPTNTVDVTASVAGAALVWDGEVDGELGTASNWVGNLAPSGLDECTVDNNTGFGGDGNWLMTLSTGNTPFGSITFSAAGTGVNAGNLGIRAGATFGAFQMAGDMVFEGSSITNEISLQGSVVNSLSYRALGNHSIINNTVAPMYFGQANGFLFSAWQNNNRILSMGGSGDIIIDSASTFSAATVGNNRRFNRLYTEPDYTGTLTIKDGVTVNLGIDLRSQGGTVKIEGVDTIQDDVSLSLANQGFGAEINIAALTDTMNALNSFGGGDLRVDGGTDVIFNDLRIASGSIDILDWAEGISSMVFTNLGATFYGGTIAEGSVFDNLTIDGSSAFMTAYTNGAVVGWAVTDGADGAEIAGVPVRWILDYWATTNDYVAAADDDGDGVDNQGEYFADTMPDSKASVLRILEVSVSDTTSTVTYQNGGPKADVIVEYSDNLVFTSFVGVGTNAAPLSTTNNYIHVGAGAPAFYQLRAQRND